MSDPERQRPPWKWLLYDMPHVLPARKHSPPKEVGWRRRWRGLRNAGSACITRNTLYI